MNTNDGYIRSFVRDLRARNLAGTTITAYLDATTTLRTHLGDTDLTQVTRDDLRGYVAHQLEHHAPATASVRYRGLQQFYKWADAEDLCENPTTGMSPPMVPEQPVDVMSIEQVKRLLGVCAGKTFHDRRDQAILRLFLEPGGMRRAEMVGLTVPSLDLDGDIVTVMGKGRRERTIWFGLKTGQALERYVRVRGLHPQRGLDWLWLGAKGPLTASGVQQMMNRRAAQAHLPHLYPHMLRHTAAHEWLAAGGQETDAMKLFGWRSRQMLGRYGASAAVARAGAASRRLGLGDRY